MNMSAKPVLNSRKRG